MASHARSADTFPHPPTDDTAPAPSWPLISWVSTARIALAVFVGVLAAMTVAGLAALLYVASVANDVADQLDSYGLDSSATAPTSAAVSSLSESCETALRGEAGQTLQDLPIDCLAEDSDAIATRMTDLNITYVGT